MHCRTFFRTLILLGITLSPLASGSQVFSASLPFSISSHKGNDSFSLSVCASATDT